jgi:hypothetical protein
MWVIWFELVWFWRDASDFVRADGELVKADGDFVRGYNDFIWYDHGFMRGVSNYLCAYYNLCKLQVILFELLQFY